MTPAILEKQNQVHTILSAALHQLCDEQTLLKNGRTFQEKRIEVKLKEHSAMIRLYDNVAFNTVAAAHAIQKTVGEGKVFREPGRTIVRFHSSGETIAEKLSSSDFVHSLQASLEGAVPDLPHSRRR